MIVVIITAESCRAESIAVVFLSTAKSLQSHSPLISLQKLHVMRHREIPAALVTRIRDGSASCVCACFWFAVMFSPLFIICVLLYGSFCCVMRESFVCVLVYLPALCTMCNRYIHKHADNKRLTTTTTSAHMPLTQSESLR